MAKKPASPAAKAPSGPAKGPRDPRPGRGWYTRQEMAEILGVSEQHFDRAFRPLAPPSSMATAERRPYFQARPLIDAWAKSQAKPAPGADSTDPMLQGPDSPALEEFRRYRAGQERIKLALMDGTAIPRAELEPALAQFAAVLRRSGESLQRQFGNDAAAVLNDAVEEAVSGWERMLSDRPVHPEPTDPRPAAGVDGPGPRPPAADDAAVR